MSKYIFETTPTYISNCYPPSTAQPGHVHFDSGTQSLKVYDGTSWHDLAQPAPHLTWEAEQAIDKMVEILNSPHIDEVAAKYPLVAEALGQLEVAIKLCQNNEPDNT